MEAFAPYFCAASETGRDIGKHLLHQDIGSFPSHPLEQHMLDNMDPTLLRQTTEHPCPPSTPSGSRASSTNTKQISSNCWRCTSMTISAWSTWMMSTSFVMPRGPCFTVSTLFPPPASGCAKDDPVSYKKLLAGDGVCAIRKEILGWIFDGILPTMELPTKVAKLLDTLSTAISRK
jgi:hypothetical protein